MKTEFRPGGPLVQRPARVCALWDVSCIYGDVDNSRSDLGPV